MGRTILATAVAALLANPLPAKALVAGPMSVTQRTIAADAVVVGKVTGIEKDPVEAVPHPQVKQKVAYQIATIRVDEGLVGAKNVTHLRVGFIPAPPAPPPPADGAPVRPAVRPLFLQTQPTVGMEGVFFLAPHPTADFFVFVPLATVAEKKSKTYEKDLEAVKQCVKIFDDPVAALKAKQQEERFLAAAVLISRYRNPRVAAAREDPKEEPIDAAESKLILRALAEADWSKADPLSGLPPRSAFAMLNPTEKDGWKSPKFEKGAKDSQKAYQDAAKKWVTENAETYRVKRFVAK